MKTCRIERLILVILFFLQRDVFTDFTQKMNRLPVIWRSDPEKETSYSGGRQTDWLDQTVGTLTQSFYFFNLNFDLGGSGSATTSQRDEVTQDGESLQALKGP